jgi:hypothetical protein
VKPAPQVGLTASNQGVLCSDAQSQLQTKTAQGLGKFPRQIAANKGKARKVTICESTLNGIA